MPFSRWVQILLIAGESVHSFFDNYCLSVIALAPFAGKPPAFSSRCAHSYAIHNQSKGRVGQMRRRDIKPMCRDQVPNKLHGHGASAILSEIAGITHE